MNKFAIYTACIGGYDNILQPEVIDERFDYFLFTNDVKEESVGVWQVRKVAYSNPDMTRIARYVKTHPEELLPEYEATLWLDSSLQVISQYIYNRFVELFNQGFNIASVKHPKRDCIYDEAFEVASRKIPGALEYDTIALKWCKKIHAEHYPPHNGLIETSILYRMNIASIKAFDDMWWACINQYSKRDQLSFNYMLWKNGLACYEFLTNGEHMMSSSNIRYAGHAKASNRKSLKLSPLELLRYKYRVRDRDKALKEWYSCIKFPFPLLYLYTYGTMIAAFNFVSNKIKKKISKYYVQENQV